MHLDNLGVFPPTRACSHRRGRAPTDEGVLLLAPTANRALINVSGAGGRPPRPGRCPGRALVASGQLGAALHAGDRHPQRAHPSAVGVSHAAFLPISGQLTRVSLFEIRPVCPCHAFDLRPADPRGGPFTGSRKHEQSS